MPVVRISDDLFARLQRHATPLVDSVSDVLEKVLNAYEHREPGLLVATSPAPKTVPAIPIGDYPSLWEAITPKFNALSPRHSVRGGGVGASFRKVLIGNPEVHYEWSHRKREGYLDVCLHFEATSRPTNLDRIKPVVAAGADIQKGIAAPFDAGAWGTKWAQARYRIKLASNWPNDEEIRLAAELMKVLIDRTYIYAEAS